MHFALPISFQLILKMVDLTALSTTKWTCKHRTCFHGSRNAFRKPGSTGYIVYTHRRMLGLQRQYFPVILWHTYKSHCGILWRDLFVFVPFIRVGFMLGSLLILVNGIICCSGFTFSPHSGITALKYLKFFVMSQSDLLNFCYNSNVISIALTAYA